MVKRRPRLGDEFIAGLDAARRYLDPPSREDRDTYVSFVRHGEHGLALALLAHIGDSQHAGDPFWAWILHTARFGGTDEAEDDDSIFDDEVRLARVRIRSSHRFCCVCCGHLVHDDKPGSHAVCPICGWVDDVTQLRWPDRAGGANRESLVDAQTALRSGYQDLPAGSGRRRATSAEPRDYRWRPFDTASDTIESRSATPAWPSNASPLRYYYWLPTPGLPAL